MESTERDIQIPETELIVVKQLPVIDEQLQGLETFWKQLVEDAKAMVCDENTVQSVKAFRAEMRKQFESAEALRKQVKKAIMEPYDRLEARFKKCITDSFNEADGVCANKVKEVEDEQKRRCEEGLRDYFAELCAVHHLDWLEYERAGIKIDMASAKAKVPSKLRKQLAEFVVGVSESVERISSLDNASEIMVEYKRTLNAAEAIYTVNDRNLRIEEQRKAQETRNSALQQEAESVRRVEALAPPVQVEQPKTVSCTFTVHATREQLKKLKEFLNMEGIQYE